MKKLLAILGMITCMVGLTACGSSKETADTSVLEEQMVLSCEQIVASMQQIVNLGAEEQYTSDEVVYNGLLSYKNALEDIGDYQGTNGGNAEFSDDEIIVNINVLGSKHNAVVEIILSKDASECTSIATNVTYSTGEKMEKAALNTLLGMGTVFIVLILISFIISAFGLISKVQNSKKKPEEAEKVDNVVAQIMEKEELSDDLELVAVISAAIAAYEGSGSTDGFVVRSIRKANKSKWQNA